MPLTKPAGSVASEGGSGGTSSISLFGVFSIVAAGTRTLTITNFDSTTSYSVSATGGTISRVDDVITYLAGSTPGSYEVSITAGGITRVLPMTITAAPPPTLGQASAGGFYAGRMNIDGNTYNLIVAPKSGGHWTNAKFKTTDSTTAGVLSLYDGLANSNAMNTAEHTAAFWARGLTIGGYSDWYLPSKQELELCYRNLKPSTTSNTVYANRTISIPSGSGNNGVDTQGSGDNPYSLPPGEEYTAGNPAQTSVPAFQTGGAEAFDETPYWSSTTFNAPYGWTIGFSTGSEGYNPKSYDNYARAVRRVLVT